MRFMACVFSYLAEMKSFLLCHSLVLQGFVETILYEVTCLGMMLLSQGLCPQEAYGNKVT